MNPGFFTTITESNVLNTKTNTSFLTVNNTTFLTTASGAAAGAIQSDYDVNATTGALTVRDVVFSLPTGGVIATYYGNESTNPLFLEYEQTPGGAGFVPPNPSYAITQYTYSSPGVISAITAYDSTGKAFAGVI